MFRFPWCLASLFYHIPFNDHAAEETLKNTLAISRSGSGIDILIFMIWVIDLSLFNLGC